MSTQTVNSRLIELLKQTIDTLSSAEKNILRSQLLPEIPFEVPYICQQEFIMDTN